MANAEAFEAAKKRVEAKMGFFTHLSVYVAVIIFLAAVNFATSFETIWVHWPMLGWGFAVAIHAVAVFVFPGRFSVTEEMITKEMEKSETPRDR